MDTKTCPLCQSKCTSHFYYQEKFNRDFFHCDSCDLRFVDRQQLVSVKEEKERYSMHDNSVKSEGYERFLLRLVKPVEKYFAIEDVGLDFGEGPYPMLRDLLHERGFKNVEGYDPLFNQRKLSSLGDFNFITCCEVIEHMSLPLDELNQIYSMMKNKAILIISTGIYGDEREFSTWHYINDETHINIFSEKTLDWIGEAFKFDTLERNKDLRVFLKK